MDKLFSGIFKGKKVLITGHTGFKGSWAALWMRELGATVCGYSLTCPTELSHLDLLKLDIESHIGDIRDLDNMKNVFSKFDPDIIFHMAAQPLVRDSYKIPIETFETNVIGSMRVYEAARACKNLKALVSITTDKVYHNNEWTWGYRESDRLGGKDPYSASKAAAEIATASFRHSFWNLEKYKKDHNVLLATARAGNVIGGGDWATDRLIPDIVKSSSEGKTVSIRSPHSTRPWQHVLEPLSGYFLLGQKLLEEEVEHADSWNFGPSVMEDVTVEQVIHRMKTRWDKVNYKIEEPKEKLHEAGLLKLDCTKAFRELEWKPVWNANMGIDSTTDWYRKYYENEEVISLKNLDKYIKDAQLMHLVWTSHA